MENNYLWAVEVTDPPTGERKWARPRRYMVVAADMEEAIFLTRTHYPEVTLIKVLRDQHVDDVLIHESPKMKLPSWTQSKCEDCESDLPVVVLHSAAGYYVGQWCQNDGPYSRLSEEYYSTQQLAELALKNNTFTMRQHP